LRTSLGCGALQPMRTGLIILAELLILASPAQAFAEAMTDDAVRRILIQESIDQYSGNCPCPENRASNGSRCGKRSAWSRAGGAAPLCYPSDVTDADVAAYRAKHAGVEVQDGRDGKRSSSQPAETKKRASTAYSSPPEMYETRTSPEPPAPTRQPIIDPEIQRLPDCPPGTSLARWKNQNICVGTPETLANVAKPEVPERPSGTGGGDNGGIQQPMNFADVLSRLQAKSSASGKPVMVPMGAPPGQALSAPAAGLLNCGAGTRPTHVDGRIECR
jgi:hypothetical protein